jgi:predicted DNA-binding transcriptional regulator AlpA
MKVYRARELYNTRERAGLLGVSESGLYLLISQGRFPKPNVRFNKRAVGWTEDVVSTAVDAMRVDR